GVDFFKRLINKVDVIMLNSDGLSNAVSENEMLEILKQTDLSLEQRAELLVNKAVFPETFNQGVGNLTGNTDHMNIGNKIIGNFLFEQKDKEDGTEYEVGYLSPGHNSVYQEEKTGQLFLVFH